MRFNELRETLQLRLSGEFKRFANKELRAVLTLLAGSGVVWELTFGSPMTKLFPQHDCLLWQGISLAPTKGYDMDF